MAHRFQAWPASIALRPVLLLALLPALFSWGLAEGHAAARSAPTTDAGPAAWVHWSFLPPVAGPLPPVHNPRWIRNPVDAFVLARLEKEGVSPSPEADRRTLLRRLSLDLVGLPPTPQQIQQFLADDSPSAYERVVDALLSSEHFGERWGRHWLDLARYADSSGYQVDRERPFAYLYRDWVIQAMNADQPFDRFTIEQLAGDLLPQPAADQRIAAGFHRLTLSNHEEGVDAEEFKCKAKVDRVSTTGTAWLGLTIGCAECHNHKYDPVTQREFYQLYAFFNNAEEVDVQEPRRAGCTIPTFQEGTNAPRAHVHVRGDFLRPGEEVGAGTPACLPPLQPRGPHPDRLDLARWLVRPSHPLTARVAVNQVWQHLFGRGLVATPDDFGSRGEPPSNPELLDWLAVTFSSPATTEVAPGGTPKTSILGAACGGCRSRGEGLAWSRKKLIRLLVTSATYRQSSRTRPELQDRDPNNVWLARQGRFRVEAEIVRDLQLFVSGLLNQDIGGPSFRPYLPDNIKKMGAAGAFTWSDSVGPERFRRGLYVYAQRTVPYPTSMAFDQADATHPCVFRERSDTPLQALTLLNHGVFVDCARGLGRRIMSWPECGTRLRIARAFEWCLGRLPGTEEGSRLEELWERQRRLLAGRPGDAAALSGLPQLTSEEQAAAASWVGVAQVLLNLDEFMTRE